MFLQSTSAFITVTFCYLIDITLKSQNHLRGHTTSKASEVSSALKLIQFLSSCLGNSSLKE